MSRKPSIDAYDSDDEYIMIEAVYEDEAASNKLTVSEPENPKSFLGKFKKALKMSRPRIKHAAESNTDLVLPEPGFGEDFAVAGSDCEPMTEKQVLPSEEPSPDVLVPSADDMPTKLGSIESRPFITNMDELDAAWDARKDQDAVKTKIASAPVLDKVELPILPEAEDRIQTPSSSPGPQTPRTSDETAVTPDASQPVSKQVKLVIHIHNIIGKYPAKLSEETKTRFGRYGISEDDFSGTVMGAREILRTEHISTTPQILKERSTQWTTFGAIAGGAVFALAGIALGPIALGLGAAGAAVGGISGNAGESLLAGKQNHEALEGYIANVNTRMRNINKCVRWRIKPARTCDKSIGLSMEVF